MRKKVVAISSAATILLASFVNYDILSNDISLDKEAVNDYNRVLPSYNTLFLDKDDYCFDNDLVPFTPKYIVEPYYEARIAEAVKTSSGLSFDMSWRKISDFDEYFGIAREVRPVYEVIAISYSFDGEITYSSIVTSDLKSVPLEYKYIHKDDYLSYEKGPSVYVKYGKVLKRVDR